MRREEKRRERGNSMTSKLELWRGGRKKQNKEDNKFQMEEFTLYSVFKNKL